MPEYGYRHGDGTLFNRDASGNFSSAFARLPLIDTLSFNLETSRIEHTDKSDSLAAIGVSIPYMFKGSGELVLASQETEILKLAWFGGSSNITGGSFTAATFASGVSLTNPYYSIPGNRVRVSSLIITDSTPVTPLVLTLGTHYEITDADAGIIKFLNLGAFVQPFKAAGTEAAGSQIALLKTRVFELGLRFKGINIANADAIEIFDLWKLQFDPTSVYNIMGDGSNVSTSTLPFVLMKDTTKADTDDLGQYGRRRV